MKPHHLEETLTKLKLFGMLDTLEIRLAQASAGDLGHVELLQSLCEDEAARRDAGGDRAPGQGGALRADRHGRGLRLQRSTRRSRPP